ncbi:MAG: hypothetical protein AB2693_27100, partial [Candidatus Thiodiazotropha sp.]
TMEFKSVSLAIRLRRKSSRSESSHFILVLYCGLSDLTGTLLHLMLNESGAWSDHSQNEQT